MLEDRKADIAAVGIVAEVPRSNLVEVPAVVNIRIAEGNLPVVGSLGRELVNRTDLGDSLRTVGCIGYRDQTCWWLLSRMIERCSGMRPEMRGWRRGSEN